MYTKVLRTIAAALVVTSLGNAAIAETLGEHPAVLVARTWNSRGIDPNTFIVQHPAGPIWLSAAPTTKENKATRNPLPRTVKGTNAPK